jgi:hypothetical protein
MDTVCIGKCRYEIEEKSSDMVNRRRFQWPYGLRRRSAAAWLLGSRIRIPLRAWMFFSRVCMLCCPM